MAEAIEYEQFDAQSSPKGDLAHANGSTSSPHRPGRGDPSDLSRLSEIPMELSVEIGRTHMTVGETLDLRVGSVVALERLAGETADLLVNGSAIARGEVVVIEEQYGLRITEILDGQDASPSRDDASPEWDDASVSASPSSSDDHAEMDGHASPEGEHAQPLATANGDAPQDGVQASSTQEETAAPAGEG